VEDSLREGQRAILRVGGGTRMYVVRIEEVREDALVLSAPVRLGHVVPVKPGTEVEMQYHQDDTMYGFHTRVEDFRPGHLPLITVARPTQIRTVQRREHVRWPVSLKVVIAVADGEREVAGRAVDLSGGGLAADLPGEWQEGQEVRVRLCLSAREIVEAGGRVVRVVRPPAPAAPTRYGWRNTVLRPARVAFEFTCITPGAREAIIRYIFSRQRQFLRSGHVGRDWGAG